MDDSADLDLRGYSATISGNNLTGWYCDVTGSGGETLDPDKVLGLPTSDAPPFATEEEAEAAALELMEAHARQNTPVDGETLRQRVASRRRDE